jgi:hypothetical protein
MKNSWVGKIALLVILLSLAGLASAQELEPRAYSPSPAGTSFLVIAFSRATGNVTFDPTIPVTNVHGAFNAPLVGIGHTFGLFGRQSLVTASLPYVYGTISGDVGEKSGSITRSGLADLGMKFSINLHGCPSQTPAEFAATPHNSFIVAASLTVDAPTGQYSSTKLINLGTNRWTFRPEIGFSYPFKKFDFDTYLASSFFTENSQYYPGTSTRGEDALNSIQAHASYTFRRALWLAIDSTWYGGGAVHTNGGPGTNLQSNSRLGATLSLPLGRHQSAKVSYSSGVTARTGSNFRTLAVAWQYVWLH